MSTITELYIFLEKKRDEEHINKVFSYDAFPPDERPKARLEILTWWKLEYLVEGKSCQIDKDFAITYFCDRIKSTSNQLLKYRYNYFAYLLNPKDNRFAKQAIEALLNTVESLLPDNKEDYPHQAEHAIGILMSLSKRVKYRISDVKRLIWKILESSNGYRTKLVCIRIAKEHMFFSSTDSEKLVCLCKELLPLTTDGWRESCCELGLFYASKLQNLAKPHTSFFYEILGDMEMEQLQDPAVEPNNIAIPLMNDGHLEKAMGFYQKAGLTEKRNTAEQKFRENKKKVVIPHIKIERKTNKQVVNYFENLAKDLLEGKLSWLLINLALPVRFMFPSFKQIRERMPDNNPTTIEELGLENTIMDINGNNRKAGIDFDMQQKYDLWITNLVRNYVIPIILSSVKTKQLTYRRLKSWFLNDTCFGIPIEYARSNRIVTASWFSQIDYGIDALIKQYNRFLQGKSTDWRTSIDVLSIRFEGVLRDMVGDYGGRVIKLGRDNCTSQALLDDLLREPCLLEVFKIEDIEFFEYVFTSKGYNIRNNVAHSFYIPSDYGIFQATLVFLCILRLTTFRPHEKENTDD